MLPINVTSNMDRLLREVKLEQKAIPKAAQRALNTAARGLKTDTGRELRRRYPKLRLKDVQDQIDISFASGAMLRAVIAVRGRPLTVGRFMTGVVTKVGGGVKVNIKGQSKLIKHAFVVDLKDKSGGDYWLVLERKGKGRYPLKATRTIDFANAANIKEVRQILDSLVSDRFDKEFARQIVVLSKA